MRTMKAVNADLDVVRKSSLVRGYGFENPVDKEKWEALLAELKAIQEARKERAFRKANRNKVFKAIYQEAQEAGLKAGKEAIPTPMVVQGHANQLDDNSPVEKEYYVSEGMCGFAWVVVSSNQAFARWLKAMEYGSHSSYERGTTIWARDFGQSITRKEAWAGAFAQVLTKNGIEAYNQSRLD